MTFFFFLVGAFLVKRARLLQWLVFFRQTTDLIVYVPFFSTDFTRFTVNPAVTGSNPCFSQKQFRAFAEADETEGFFFIFFSTLCDFFQFICLQRVHLEVFLIFCSKLKCQEAQMVCPFKYFGTETVQNSYFSFFFRNFLNFLKSKNKIRKFFVSKGSPLQFGLISCNKLDFQKGRRSPPFTVLKILRFLSLRCSADLRLDIPVMFLSPDQRRHTERSTFYSLFICLPILLESKFGCIQRVPS